VIRLHVQGSNSCHLSFQIFATHSAASTVLEVASQVEKTSRVLWFYKLYHLTVSFTPLFDIPFGGHIKDALYVSPPTGYHISGTCRTDESFGNLSYTRLA